MKFRENPFPIKQLNRKAYSIAVINSLSTSSSLSYRVIATTTGPVAVLLQCIVVFVL